MPFTFSPNQSISLSLDHFFPKTSNSSFDMNSILEDDNENSNVEAIDRATQTLCTLKDLKSKKSVSLKLRKNLACPEEFRCPLSKELIRDPVIVASGLLFYL